MLGCSALPQALRLVQPPPRLTPAPCCAGYRMHLPGGRAVCAARHRAGHRGAADPVLRRRRGGHRWVCCCYGNAACTNACYGTRPVLHKPGLQWCAYPPLTSLHFCWTKYTRLAAPVWAPAALHRHRRADCHLPRAPPRHEPGGGAPPLLLHGFKGTKGHMVTGTLLWFLHKSCRRACTSQPACQHPTRM